MKIIFLSWNLVFFLIPWNGAGMTDSFLYLFFILRVQTLRQYDYVLLSCATLSVSLIAFSRFLGPYPRQWALISLIVLRARSSFSMMTGCPTTVSSLSWLHPRIGAFGLFRCPSNWMPLILSFQGISFLFFAFRPFWVVSISRFFVS